MDLTNIKVEPCKVSWNGSDLGFTEGDLEISMEESSVDITAHQEGTNVLDSIRTGKKISGMKLTLKETSLAQVNLRLALGGGTSNTTAEVANLTCVADVADSLHGKTFPLIARDGTKYLFQLHTSAIVAPVITGWTVVQVAITTGDTANTVADAVSAAIDALAAFVAPNPAAAIIAITQATGGAVPAGSGVGNTGFTYAVVTPGASTLTGWGASKDFTSMLADSQKLVLHPVAKDDLDLTEDMAFWKAYPMLNSIKLSGENPKLVEVEFKIFPDLSKNKAIRLFVQGDHS
jgi:hypothetical protein